MTTEAPADTAPPGVAMGDRLPVSSLQAHDGTVQLRPSARRAVILVFPHPGCDACERYVAGLSAAAPDLSRWHAELLLVADAPSGGDRLRHIPDDGDLRARFGFADGTIAVVVADRHGEVWESVRTADHGALPAPQELAQSVRFIAIQCPECDVLDIPG